MKYSQPKRSFRFQGHAENVLLLCLKQQHIKTAINRSAAFCPLPCGGQEPCGRFYRPFFCGSHAPSSDAFFSADTFFSYFSYLHSTGVSFCIFWRMVSPPEKNTVFASMQPCRDSLYIRPSRPVNLFLQKTFLFQSFFPQSIGKVVENHAIL